MSAFFFVKCLNALKRCSFAVFEAKFLEENWERLCRQY
jgi:hypothetical protein